jgi:hypothetical protein
MNRYETRPIRSRSNGQRLMKPRIAFYRMISHLRSLTAREKQYAASNPSRPAAIQRLTAISHHRAAAAVARPSYAAAPLPETAIPLSQPPSLSLMHPIACTSDFETTHEHIPAHGDPSNPDHSVAVNLP